MHNDLSICIGDIIFSHGYGWVERKIRYFTKSNINHVGIIVKVHEDGVDVLEAAFTGVRTHFYHNNYIKSQCEIRRLSKRMTKDQVADLHMMAKVLDGSPYDYLAIFQNFLNIITGGWYTGLIHTRRWFICSELVIYILSQLGYKKAVQNYTVTNPEDLRKLLPGVVVPLNESL